MNDKQMVIIVGDHPHVGRTGEFTGTGITLRSGKQMARIEFEDGTSCYARAENLKKLGTKKGNQ